MTSAILVSAPHHFSLYLNCSLPTPPCLASPIIRIRIRIRRRRDIMIKTLSVTALNLVVSDICWSSGFSEIPNSGGVKALDLRVGDGQLPVSGDQVYIHYYGRLAAKQGWRFDSTYDHKDETGEPIPFTFILGSGKVISGIEAAVRSMKVGSIRRVVIPPSQGYQNTSQEPIPPSAKAVHYDIQSDTPRQWRRLDSWNSRI